MPRSNLVEVKKNKTLSWLCYLPEKEQLTVLDLAVKQRRCVLKEYKDEEEQRPTHRRQKMVKKMLREKL